MNHHAHYFDSISTAYIDNNRQDPGKFAEYLEKTKNTICGRHPIGILLHV